MRIANTPLVSGYGNMGVGGIFGVPPKRKFFENIPLTNQIKFWSFPLPACIECNIMYVIHVWYLVYQELILP